MTSDTTHQVEPYDVTSSVYSVRECGEEAMVFLHICTADRTKL